MDELKKTVDKLNYKIEKYENTLLKRKGTDARRGPCFTVIPVEIERLTCEMEDLT